MVRQLNVEQFYQFYEFLKEVMPVMNLIAEKYDKEEAEFDMTDAIDKLGKRNSIHEKHKENITLPGAENFLLNPKDIDKYRVSGERKSLPKEEAKVTSADPNAGLYDEDDNDCSVCLFARIEVVLPCGHAFCEACITDWLKK
jgi:hypothetical protein